MNGFSVKLSSLKRYNNGPLECSVCGVIDNVPVCDGEGRRMHVKCSFKLAAIFTAEKSVNAAVTREAKACGLSPLKLTTTALVPLWRSVCGKLNDDQLKSGVAEKMWIAILRKRGDLKEPAQASLF